MSQDFNQPLSDFQYRLAIKHDNYKESVIEKTGIKGRFTLLEVEMHQAKLQRVLKEIEGQIELSGAQVKNIEENHSFVKRLTDEELHHAALYFEIFSTLKDSKEKLKQVKAALQEYDDETGMILDALGLPKTEIVSDQ